MADKLEKSNHQQQRHQDENVDEPEQERYKPNECESPANTVEPKKITNIYYDCLERIFDFLDLESLLMVAQTCKRLQIAAAAKFGDEFGIERIHLYPSEPEPEVIVDQDEDDVEVRGMKLCLAFLRCFGAKISDLLVVYTFAHSKGGYFDQYINQYCADTLTTIIFYNNWQFSNELFKKPFKNVEKVVLKRCHLKNQLKDFVNWFPKLRNLEILSCSVDETAPMNVSFTHLEHLELDITESPFKFRIEGAANLLQANPQLKSLSIWWESEMSLSTVLDTIGANSSITKLEVVGRSLFSPVFNVNTDELNRFAIERPLVKELILDNHRMTAEDAINFIRRMKSLKRIEFEVKDRPDGDRITQELNNEWKSEVSTEDDKFHIKLRR